MFTTAKSRKKTIPKMIAATALIPSQSATRRSPGLPARARLFSVRSANDVLVIRATEPDRRAASGRRVRSRNGAWSSSSSRFLACMVPSWVSRAWTGSTARPLGQSGDDEQDGPRGSRGDQDDRQHDQTSMSTILRMNMKPMNIMKPPKIRMMTPAGRPAMLTESSNIGAMKPGAAMNRKPARPIGRKPTT